MLKEYPLISIITVHFNAIDETLALLESLRINLTYPNVELIIVDNCSREDISNRVKSINPTALYIRSNQNLGFAGGNNLGIRQAKGDFVFLVNNDTEWTPYLLENLVSVFQDKPDAGIVCPKFHYFFAKGTIEYAGYQPVSNFTGRNAMIGCKEKDEGQYDELKETHYAHGGAMLVSKEVLEKVGLMYEDYFLYYEEFDWCENIKRKGYKIYYQPAALIYHKESMSTGKASPLKTYYLTRNRILFMRRNRKGAAFAVFLGYLCLFTIPKNTFSFLVNGQMEHLKSFWRGIFWHFKKNEFLAT